MADEEHGPLHDAMMSVVTGQPQDALDKYEITVEDMQETAHAVIGVVMSDATEMMGGAARAISTDDLMFLFMLGVFAGARHQEVRA